MIDDYVGGYSPIEQENIELECQVDRLTEENEQLKLQVEKLKETNKQLEQEKCELLGIIQKKDELIQKMKRCENCSKRANCIRANRVRCRVYKTCDEWEMKE